MTEFLVLITTQHTDNKVGSWLTDWYLMAPLREICYTLSTKWRPEILNERGSKTEHPIWCNSASHPSGVGKRAPASAGKAKARVGKYRKYQIFLIFSIMSIFLIFSIYIEHLHIHGSDCICCCVVTVTIRELVVGPFWLCGWRLFC